MLLGIGGTIQGIDVDTSHFIGNFPPKISIQAAVMPRERKKLDYKCYYPYECIFIAEEEKLPIRRSHIGNEAYLDQMVIANSLHTEVN